MSKLLVQLLDVSERDFRSFVARLERMCLNPGIDIRLSAEIVSKVSEKLKALGLAQQDTTGKELFFALQARLRVDDKKLQAILKVQKKSADQLAKIFAKTVSKLSKDDLALCMTSAGTRRVLLAVPPRKTMRLLKLRSLESVMKREDPKILYSLAVLLEDTSWRSQAHAKMKRLQARDIVWQPVSVYALPKVWFDKVQIKLEVKGLHFTCPEVGAVIALPIIEKIRDGASVLAIGHLLQAVQRISVDSLPYRSRGFLQGYDTILPEIAHREQPTFTAIHGLLPSWRSVYELIGRGSLKPYLPTGDLEMNELSWQSIELKLTSLDPTFDFWVDTHYLALQDGNLTTSLHILDVARSLVLQVEYGDESKSHLEYSLWNEIQMRYLQHDSVVRVLVKQLQPEQVGVVL